MRGWPQFRSWLAELQTDYTRAPGNHDDGSEDESEEEGSEEESEGEESAPDGQQPAREHAGSSGGSDGNGDGSDDGSGSEDGSGSGSESAASAEDELDDPDRWFVYERLPYISVPEVLTLAMAAFEADDVAAMAVGMEAVSWLLVLPPDDVW